MSLPSSEAEKKMYSEGCITSYTVFMGIPERVTLCIN